MNIKGKYFHKVADVYTLNVNVILEAFTLYKVLYVSGVGCGA